MKLETQRIVRHILKQCKKYKVTANLTRENSVEASPGVRCSGYFDDETLVLACALGKPEDDWLRILIHEFCHVEQWVEQCKAWTDYDFARQDENGMSIDDWLDGTIEATHEQLWPMCIASMNVEADCEKRVVQKCKDYNLDIDVEEYIQRANAYVYYYHIVLKKRAWYKTGREPYTLREVWSKMPKTFPENHDVLPPGLEDAFEPCFQTEAA